MNVLNAPLVRVVAFETSCKLLILKAVHLYNHTAIPTDGNTHSHSHSLSTSSTSLLSLVLCELIDFFIYILHSETNQFVLKNCILNFKNGIYILYIYIYIYNKLFIYIYSFI